MKQKFKTMKTTLRRIFCAMAIFSLFIGMFGMPEVHAANNKGMYDLMAARASRSVDTIITDTMSQGGCWAQVKFRVNGTYSYSGSTITSNKISVSIKSAPSDWVVAIDRTDFEVKGSKLYVMISYHYKASYFDCAFTGGYVYTAVGGTV